MNFDIPKLANIEPGPAKTLSSRLPVSASYLPGFATFLPHCKSPSRLPAGPPLPPLVYGSNRLPNRSSTVPGVSGSGNIYAHSALNSTQACSSPSYANYHTVKPELHADSSYCTSVFERGGDGSGSGVNFQGSATNRTSGSTQKTSGYFAAAPSRSAKDPARPPNMVTPGAKSVLTTSAGERIFTDVKSYTQRFTPVSSPLYQRERLSSKGNQFLTEPVPFSLPPQGMLVSSSGDTASCCAQFFTQPSLPSNSALRASGAEESMRSQCIQFVNVRQMPGANEKVSKSSKFLTEPTPIAGGSLQRDVNAQVILKSPDKVLFGCQPPILPSRHSSREGASKMAAPKAVQFPRRVTSMSRDPFSAGVPVTAQYPRQTTLASRDLSAEVPATVQHPRQATPVSRDFSAGVPDAVQFLTSRHAQTSPCVKPVYRKSWSHAAAKSSFSDPSVGVFCAVGVVQKSSAKGNPVSSARKSVQLPPLSHRDSVCPQRCQPLAEAPTAGVQPHSSGNLSAITYSTGGSMPCSAIGVTAVAPSTRTMCSSVDVSAANISDNANGLSSFTPSYTHTSDGSVAASVETNNRQLTLLAQPSGKQRNRKTGAQVYATQSDNKQLEDGSLGDNLGYPLKQNSHKDSMQPLKNNQQAHIKRRQSSNDSRLACANSELVHLIGDQKQLGSSSTLSRDDSGNISRVYDQRKSRTISNERPGCSFGDSLNDVRSASPVYSMVIKSVRELKGHGHEGVAGREGEGQHNVPTTLKAFLHHAGRQIPPLQDSRKDAAIKPDISLIVQEQCVSENVSVVTLRAPDTSLYMTQQNGATTSQTESEFSLQDAKMQLTVKSMSNNTPTSQNIPPPPPPILPPPPPPAPPSPPPFDVVVDESHPGLDMLSDVSLLVESMTSHSSSDAAAKRSIEGSIVTSSEAECSYQDSFPAITGDGADLLLSPPTATYVGTISTDSQGEGACSSSTDLNQPNDSYRQATDGSERFTLMNPAAHAALQQQQLDCFSPDPYTTQVELEGCALPNHPAPYPMMTMLLPPRPPVPKTSSAFTTIGGGGDLLTGQCDDTDPFKGNPASHSLVLKIPEKMVMSSAPAVNVPSVERRGRPRKKKDDCKQTTTRPRERSDEPMTRKRGRPRKSKNCVPAAPETEELKCTAIVDSGPLLPSPSKQRSEPQDQPIEGGPFQPLHPGTTPEYPVLQHHKSKDDAGQDQVSSYSLSSANVNVLKKMSPNDVRSVSPDTADSCSKIICEATVKTAEETAATEDVQLQSIEVAQHRNPEGPKPKQDVVNGENGAVSSVLDYEQREESGPALLPLALPEDVADSSDDKDPATTIGDVHLTRNQSPHNQVDTVSLPYQTPDFDPLVIAEEEVTCTQSEDDDTIVTKADYRQASVKMEKYDDLGGAGPSSRKSQIGVSCYAAADADVVKPFGSQSPARKRVQGSKEMASPSLKKNYREGSTKKLNYGLSCQVCARQYSTPGTLTRHKRLFHPSLYLSDAAFVELPLLSPKSSSFSPGKPLTLTRHSPDPPKVDPCTYPYPTNLLSGKTHEGKTKTEAMAKSRSPDAGTKSARRKTKRKMDSDQEEWQPKVKKQFAAGNRKRSRDKKPAAFPDEARGAQATGVPERKRRCPKVTIELKTKRKLRNKMASSLGKRVLNFRTKKRTRVNSTIPCSYCSKMFSVMSNLKRHTKRDHHDTYVFVCNICPCKFNMRRTLRRHVKDKHSHTYPAYCPDCLACFRSEKDMCEHRKCHDIRKFPCEDCHLVFYTEDHLGDHITQYHVTVNGTHGHSDTGFESDVQF